MAGGCLEWRGGVEFAAGVVVGRGWYRVCGGRGGRGMCGGGGGHGGRVCLDRVSELNLKWTGGKTET